jgi:AAA+ ATPase superfamily predicted ATPase
MESILTSIKKLLGIAEEYTHFDSDLIMHINSVFLVLHQLGIGPANGFFISDKSDTWDDFLEDNTNLEMVKSYMHMKVKLLFDPPLSSSVIESMNRMIAEFEWRLNVAVESREEAL